MKFKERWWNCNDVVIKSIKEGKVVLEAAHVLFSNQTSVCLGTAISDEAFG